jgi:hypothetical protein
MGWARYLQSVSVPFAIPMRFGVEQNDGREQVFVEVTVKDSKGDETITVKTRQHVQPLGLLTNEEAAGVVRSLVRIAVLHEIDETITIGGERVFDPHRKRSLPPESANP